MTTVQSYIDSNGSNYAEFGRRVGCHGSVMSRIARGVHTASPDTAAAIVVHSAGAIRLDDVYAAQLEAARKAVVKAARGKPTGRPRRG